MLQFKPILHIKPEASYTSSYDCECYTSIIWNKNRISQVTRPINLLWTSVHNGLTAPQLYQGRAGHKNIVENSTGAGTFGVFCAALGPIQMTHLVNGPRTVHSSYLSQKAGQNYRRALLWPLVIFDL